MKRGKRKEKVPTGEEGGRKKRTRELRRRSAGKGDALERAHKFGARERKER